MTPAAGELDVFSCPLEGIALIEASAGTGKTWNICALYLRHLLEKDLPVARLLVMTFTRAATAELSARIRSRILAALRAIEHRAADSGGDAFTAGLLAAARAAGVDDDTARRRLQAALVSFDEAAIFTIHGFCQRALADASFSAGLPHALEVGEDDSDLRLEETRDFWRRELAGIDAALAGYLLACGDSPERWAQWLKESQKRPLARVLWDEDGDAGHRDSSDALAAACEAAYRKAAELWNGGGAPRQALLDASHRPRGNRLNGRTYKADSIEAAFRQWSAWLAMDDARAGLGRKDKRKLRLFGMAEIAKGTNKGHVPPSHAFFEAAQDLLDVCERLGQALEAARRRLLQRFIECAGTGLRARKQAERRISFDDMLWNAYDALASGRRPWLAEALHMRYPVALVDEFQDTDPLQLAVFRSIYASGNRRGGLFLVGDPKQAIYSFRGADLHTYLGARALADARYTLGVNRRSAPALVTACNRLFGANPRTFMEKGLDFQPAQVQPLPETIDDRTSPGHEAALCLWRIPCDGADGGHLLRADAFARAAQASAAEIARLLAAGERGEIRIGANALEPSNLAVLVRRHSEGRLMREALSARGVGSVELSQSSVFDSFEAEELGRVLMAIADPSRERLLKTALATVLMGGDATALARLADDDDAYFRQSERFGGWHEDWRRHGFAFMLWRWMAGAGVAERLLALGDGERRLTNLLHLGELLQRESGRDSPAGLLRTFARRRAEGGGGDDALLRLESDRNLVQIVTIHRAKGLQYGIVFCPFLFDGLPPKGQAGPMRLWHDADGGQVADWRHAAKDEEAIKDCLARERDAETLRLIYVALTRAEHRCYLTVGCYGRKSRDVSFRESTHSLLNWMAAGAGSRPDEWRKSKIAPDEIDACWRALADDSGGMITLGDLPAGGGESLPRSGGRETFSAPRAPRVPEGWRLSSFSALVSGAAHEDAARDHDARTESPSVAAEPAAVSMAEDDILRFPRGASAGDCVHAVFESIDFTRPGTWPDAIARALAAHPPAAGTLAPGVAALLPRMLTKMLDNVLSTPLLAAEGVEASLCLSAVPVARHLAEFEFYLPSPHLDIGALNGWLARHGYDAPRLTARDLGGYLKGYIDLVFEHAGRYWVLDWKSNYLGETPESYAPPALEGTMARHGYHLQHLLYTVALHRHLGRTLPGYDYERHFGGALYLFVRGIRPGWRETGGAPCGVFRHRVPKAVAGSLDALLAGGCANGGKRGGQ